MVAFLAALPIVADWIAENVDGGEPADGDEHAASSATGCEGHGIRARQVGPTTNAILLPMMVVSLLCSACVCGACHVHTHTVCVRSLLAVHAFFGIVRNNNHKS